ncbi:MAG: ArnT family glycosyltransferase [Halothermotrichaceae bacterium]
MRYLKRIKIIHIIIIIFFFTNLFFLTGFPFIHSDEAWLSGLSRNMQQKKNLSITEPFFDLYPRNPHAIKILFHLIQISFLKLMGYSIFTFRIISLLAGTAALYLFYKLAQKFTNSKILANLAALIIGIDIQFTYASHFARQEIILLLILLFGLYYFLYKYSYKNSIRQDIIMGLILGTAVGIHPNSFVIALPFIFIYTYKLLISKKIRLYNYIIFISTVGLIALIFVIISLRFDPDFIYNYSSYGKSLGVFSSILTKIDRLDYFYQKLFYRISGTYYTPPIKFQFVLFTLALIYSILQLFINKNTKRKNKYIILLLIFLGINIGYVIIGRYNQTGIIFIFPICYLLILNIITSFKKNYRYVIITIIIATLAFNTTSTLITDTHFNYNNYLTQIGKVVDKDDRVLANLNSEYYFNNGKLLDYRNLAYLEENNINFSEYISSNQIDYIIYPEEMDFIYNNRPVWNILYGNLFPYYQDMKRFLENKCRLVYSFTNKTYGMRIARYVGKKNWNIKIYKVKK